MLVYNTNDLMLHFVPVIRRWFPQRKPSYVHPTTYISKILNRISSNVFAVPCDSSQQTALRGYADRVQTEIVQVRAENAAIRDELQKLEDRQRMLQLHGAEAEAGM